MSFLCKQLSDNRWGIYSGTRLLATVSDRATCEAIMTSFENSHRAPSAGYAGLKTSLEQTAPSIAAPNAKNVDAVDLSVGTQRVRPSAAANLAPDAVKTGKTAAGIAGTLSDEELAKVLNVKSLKVRELESAVLQAQISHNR